MLPLKPRAKLLVLALALHVLAPLSTLEAQAPSTVAVGDFVVNSANPSYLYLGKGFAEIVAFELGKSPAIKLVDREKRNSILEEMEFSLSGAVDPAAQLEMGRLLAVRYLVSGSITDMGGPLLVSLSMVDVESGAVVWSDQLTEKSGRYAYIGAYFGKSLLAHFKVAASKTTELALASTKEADEASVVALSRGLAALDEGRTDEAKKELAAAKKLDPANAVAQAFLDRLAAASAKFKVVPERYVSYYNPAYLGGMEKDKLYFSQSLGNHLYGFVDTNNDGQLIERTGDLVWGVGEERDSASYGYLFPLGAIGLGFQFDDCQWGDSVVYDNPGAPVEYQQQGNQYTEYAGGSLQAGLALSPSIGVGVGVSAAYLRRAYYTPATGTPYPEHDLSSVGGFLGLVIRDPGGVFTWDVLAGWSTEPQYWFDRDATEFVRNQAPIYVEQTLGATLFGGKAFIALKQLNDIFPDRATWYGRLMPAAELWLFDLVGLRAGVEGSVVLRDGSTEFGWGATGGLSLRVWKLEADVNYTFRMRPSRSLVDVVVPESVLFFTLSASDLVTAFF